MKKRKMSSNHFVFFKQGLMHWHHHHNHRAMPWKGVKDIYRIWLSEVILQQTRVEQGLGYYERFLKAYPDIFALAGAPEQEVFKLWEGLGYYSRCKNLIATARIIASERKGTFPDNYEELLSLKGIGPYTAAAIASFGYSLPVPVVDGNVIRVLSRYFGIDTPVQRSEGKKLIQSLAEQCLDHEQPAAYNQAIMDFGATICKPQLPLCTECVLHTTCRAFTSSSVHAYPVKTKKSPVKKRWFIVMIVTDHTGRFAVRQRKEGDIWAGLYEFPSLECRTQKEWIRFMKQHDTSISSLSNAIEPVRENKLYSQLLSHQKIHLQIISCSITQRAHLKVPAEWLTSKEMTQLAFPRIYRDILHDKGMISLADSL
jgi:A/G-specific adenine glycosylase